MIAIRVAAGIGPAVCLLLSLSGCATHTPLIENPAGASAAPVELADTPFFPQRTHECGPAALATVLGASGVDVTPDDLEPIVYLPGRRGSLQVEMQAAPRRYARLSYPLGPNLADIVGELRAGRPVLVLHNYGVPFWPRWHYAAAIGYDPTRDTIILRSGTTRRQVFSARNFMRAWDNGGRWALVLLKPGELPSSPDRTSYLEAAAAFELTARPADARAVFDAALKQWPEAPVAWIGRGTANYKSGNLKAAAEDYSTALQLDPTQAGARNNLAMTLLERGCADAARTEIAKIDLAKVSGALGEAVRDTQTRIEHDASRAQNCDGAANSAAPSH